LIYSIERMLYQQPYHLESGPDGKIKIGGGPPCQPGSSLKPRTTQVGGGSDYQGLFHAVPMNPRELSLVTARYIDQSPMFNPLRKNTVIPTIYNGIIPTGAYLYNNLPTNPDYSKYNGNPLSVDDLHCLCQKKGIQLYDEINGKLVPRSQTTLVQRLNQVI